MESMVEKIAGAILKHLLSGGEYVKDLGYGLIKVDQCLDLQEISRVVLKAMREPTEMMVEAGAEANYGWTRAESAERAKEAVFEEHASNAKVLYQAYIDAALKETV